MQKRASFGELAIDLLVRVAGRTLLGLMLGFAAAGVLSGFFPHMDLAIQNWALANQTHKDSISAAVAPALLFTMGGGALGFLSAFVPRRKR